MYNDKKNKKCIKMYNDKKIKKKVILTPVYRC